MRRALLALALVFLAVLACRSAPPPASALRGEGAPAEPEVPQVIVAAGEWIPVRIVAIGDAADIFVGDMETPLLHVPDLRIDGAHGAIGLFMSDRPWMQDTGAWFSNVSIREATDADRVVGLCRSVAEGPGIVADACRGSRHSRRSVQLVQSVPARAPRCQSTATDARTL